MSFLLEKTGVSRKTLSFLARFFIFFFILVLDGFFVYFSPYFSIKTRIKVFCIADLIILIFSMLRQGTRGIMSVMIVL